MSTESLSPEDAAREAGLRWSTDAAPGISRRRAGKSFAYRDASGSGVDAETLERVRALAIPPAWTDVWISPSRRGHIQATGRDARGRKQYIYHADWSAARGATKYHRMLAFGKALPGIREQVDADMRSRELTRARVVANIVHLLDLTGLRVGNEEYARENGSFGLTTLRNRHAKVDGETVRLVFDGKGGKKQRVRVSNRRVANTVRRLEELPGQRLFQYLGDDGQAHTVESDDINRYLQECAGEAFTAKDFRTWNASVLAARSLAEVPAPESKRESKAAVKEALCVVSEALGNTPTICRTSYVHPLVFEAFESGELQELWHKGRRRWEVGEREAGEMLFVALLRGREEGGGKR